MNKINVGDMVAWKDVPEGAKVLGPQGIMFRRQGDVFTFDKVDGQGELRLQDLPVVETVMVVATIRHLLIT